MTPDEYRSWWMAYEPETPYTTSCPRCNEATYHSHGPAHQPFGLGIVICTKCGKHYSHIRRWVACGLDEGFDIPDKYLDALDIDEDADPDDVWTKEVANCNGVYVP